MKKTQAGFTLIELMIVIAILGILASIAIGAYTDYSIRAKVSEGVNSANVFTTAYGAFYYTTGRLPASREELGTSNIITSYVEGVTITAGGLIPSISTKLIRGSVNVQQMICLSFSGHA
jgi:type IV pilus assembly protein PilA